MLVDGAQAVGAIPANVRDLGVDMYAIPAQKWLLGPEGLGALWIRRELLDDAKAHLRRATSTFASYDSRGNRMLAVDARRFQVAGFHRPSVLGLGRAIGWLTMYVGLEFVYRRGAEMAHRAADLLAAIDGVSCSRRATGWPASCPSALRGWEPQPALDELQARTFCICPHAADRRRSPDQRRVLDDRGRDRPVRRRRSTPRRAHARVDPAPAHADDPERLMSAPARRRRGARGCPFAGGSSATRRARSCEPSAPASRWPSCWERRISPTTWRCRAARRCPAATCASRPRSLSSSRCSPPGRSSRGWSCHSRAASGTRTTRTPWSAALGLFAAIPIAYLVLVVAIQVLKPLLV